MNIYKLLFLLFPISAFAQANLGTIQKKWIISFIPKGYEMRNACLYFYDDNGKITREEEYDSKFKLWNVSYYLYNQDSLGKNKIKNNQKNISNVFYYRDTLIMKSEWLRYDTVEERRMYKYDTNNLLIECLQFKKDGNDFYQKYIYVYNQENKILNEIFYWHDTTDYASKTTYTYNDKGQLAFKILDFKMHNWKTKSEYIYNRELLHKEIYTSPSENMEFIHTYNKQNKIALIDYLKNKKIIGKDITIYNKEGEKKLLLSVRKKEKVKSEKGVPAAPMNTVIPASQE